MVVVTRAAVRRASEALSQEPEDKPDEAMSLGSEDDEEADAQPEEGKRHDCCQRKCFHSPCHEAHEGLLRDHGEEIRDCEQKGAQGHQQVRVQT